VSKTDLQKGLHADDLLAQWLRIKKHLFHRHEMFLIAREVFSFSPLLFRQPMYIPCAILKGENMLFTLSSNAHQTQPGYIHLFSSLE
jgi:hypothetical protein